MDYSHEGFDQGTSNAIPSVNLLNRPKLARRKSSTFLCQPEKRTAVEKTKTQDSIEEHSPDYRQYSRTTVVKLLAIHSTVKLSKIHVVRISHLLAALGQRLEHGRHGREPFKKYALISFSDSFQLPCPVHQSSLMELREVLDLHLT